MSAKAMLSDSSAIDMKGQNMSCTGQCRALGEQLLRVPAVQ